MLSAGDPWQGYSEGGFGDNTCAEKFGCCPGTKDFNATLCAAAQWSDKAGKLHPLGGQDACKEACAAYVGTTSFEGGAPQRALLIYRCRCGHV